VSAAKDANLAPFTAAGVSCVFHASSPDAAPHRRPSASLPASPAGQRSGRGAVPDLTSIAGINLNTRIGLLSILEPIACGRRTFCPLALDPSEDQSLQPAGAEFWHLWTVIIPRLSIAGGLVHGRVWRRHDGRRWQYRAITEYDQDQE
jgi:hypothetical protein